MTVYLSGINYQVGEVRPIEELFGDAMSSGLSASYFLQRGLESYCVQHEDTWETCARVAREGIRLAGRQPGDVQAVIVANAIADAGFDEELAFMKGLQDAGIGDVPVIGLSMQACSGAASALALASRMVSAPSLISHVLVIIAGKVCEGRSRIGLASATIYSDGMAAAVVSSEAGEFELLASSMTTSLSASASENEKRGSSMLRGFTQLAKIASQLYNQTDTRGCEVAALFCTNGNLTYNSVAADAADIPLERVHASDLRRYAHVHSCDNLIGLVTYRESHSFRRGTTYMLLGWSAYVFSGALLRYIGD